MKKLFLIRNPELFQGKRFLKKDKNYFEGWYFKNTNKKKGISFIPGININKEEKKAFIQIITNDKSYFVDYDIDEFSYNDEPFYIKIGNNYFSKDDIKINIKDEKQNLIVNGWIKYAKQQNIKTTLITPNIMGIFSYVPFMECNHGILCMKSQACGIIEINAEKIIFNKGIGYIEKDWGTSFPKSYVWIQGNNFKNNNVSFMMSVADIPFNFFNFTGFLSSLIIDDKEYRFATYNNAKLIKYEIKNGFLNIILKSGKYYLEVNTKYNEGLKLIAPVKGKMNKDIIESISSNIYVTLKEKDKIIFNGSSKNCGLEIVTK